MGNNSHNVVIIYDLKIWWSVFWVLINVVELWDFIGGLVVLKLIITNRNAEHNEED